MILLGTLVNAIAIIAGALLGRLLSGIPESIRKTVMQGIGLAIVLLGIKMSLETQNFLLVILSIVIGSILGELIGIESGLNKLGQWLESKMGGRSQGSIATGFVTTTLVYCIGAMAVLGAMDSGLRNNHEILYTKAMLDGFSAIIFSSTLGIGVLFSAVPVFLYQGAIALLSTQIYNFVSQETLDAMLVEVTAVGGLMIIAIGINILELKKINVANMLPALVIAAIGVPIVRWLAVWFG
ncbi:MULTISPECIES: DUF554 domain-containing protein [Brevibacillus]|uniref:Transport protein n=1 Tax=Brevibacillus borstelensis AK1 TaxID=1300222 RepID=M8E067_9BACL|nr:DUF554 domain-containing protein [Brevibacillus borstelensis]EMT52681.1 hypothetical protein I532_13529 [Brevibacillus borstelensis AK1]KKX55047.1 membrane protein [Brevibacillus borstelensis cifa_chp40]MBE5396082.1 DUF554 domain-containing protein [Brevibacillus borstelensis]MCC0566651.1 DUF554 domain-containing protein [Brevibacillus borstelensis]MCM3472318.1 DUF554 domain-containing protein [Brevibacillus borstelensis]